MLTFLRQFFRDARNTGSIMPSSPALARAMVAGLGTGGPQRWLEVGPGTGPFTRALLATKRPGDRLVIVELSRDFCVRLEVDILEPWNAAHRAQAGEVALINAPIEEARLEPGFDHVVCGLPFNNFPPKLMRRIFRRMFALLKVGGELVYFEYAGVRVMKSPVVDGAGRARLRRIDTIGKSLRRRHAGKRELVLANFPPAYAYRLVNAGPDGAKRTRRAPARGGATARR